MLAGKAPFSHPLDGRQIESVLSRDWIDRIWTLQEVVLAKRPVICCSTRFLTWRCFIYGTVFVEYKRDLAPERYGESWERVFASWHNVIGLWLCLHKDKGYGTFHIYSPEEDSEQSVFDSHIEPYLRFLEAVLSYRNGFQIGTFVLVWAAGFVLMVVVPTAFVSQFMDSMEESALIIGNLTFMGLSVFWMVAFTFGISYLLSFVGNDIKRSLEHRKHSAVFSPREALVQAIRTRRTTNDYDRSFGVHSILSRFHSLT